MRETAAPETPKGAGEECFGSSALARFGKRAACAPDFGCVRAREGRERSRNVSWNQRLNKLRTYRGLREFWTFWTPESSGFFDLEPSSPGWKCQGRQAELKADVENKALKRTGSAIQFILNRIVAFGANELRGVKSFVMWGISRDFRERFIPAYSRFDLDLRRSICSSELGKT